MHKCIMVDYVIYFRSTILYNNIVRDIGLNVNKIFLKRCFGDTENSRFCMDFTKTCLKNADYKLVLSKIGHKIERKFYNLLLLCYK